ncbi:MAG: NlpC/P60 family protein [Ruminococcaceae bacterium]|nr:NlpC/P60 family protein [Oscillospiraceae bacterium]
MNILKKAVAVVAVTAALLGSVSVGVGASSFPCVGIVVANTVNVRSGPGTNHVIEAVVDYGQTLDVFEKTNNWYRIGTGGGNYAYISADYVSIRPEDVASRGSMTGGNRVVQVARQYLGTPYVYGGSSPSGFDCSGFTSYVYRQLGYSINRTAHSQLSNGVPVSKSELQPGDIVMFKRAGNSQVHHVGIYAGDGMMIHSPQTGDVVKYTSINTGYYNDVYYAARRIIR